jgi:hypothetical protein
MGHAFGERWTDMDPGEIRRVTAVLERLTRGNDRSGDLIATGFLESLVAVVRGDAKEERVLAALGPRGREHYRFWADY